MDYNAVYAKRHKAMKGNSIPSEPRGERGKTRPRAVSDEE